MNNKQDFTFFQRINNFLNQYNTLKLEFGIRIVGALFFVLGMILPTFLGQDSFIGRNFFQFMTILAFFTFGIAGWVRMIKGERVKNFQVVRNRTSVYLGFVMVVINWGCAFSLFFIFFFAE